MRPDVRTIEPAQQTAAKVAGFTGLFTMAIAVFAQYGITPHLSVAGDAAATARNILAHEGLFPNFAKILNPYWYDSPMGIFEMALSAWLLFKGLRPSRMAANA